MVRLRGLPFRITHDEIREFFAPLKPVDVRMVKVRPLKALPSFLYTVRALPEPTNNNLLASFRPPLKSALRAARLSNF